MGVNDLEEVQKEIIKIFNDFSKEIEFHKEKEPQNKLKWNKYKGDVGVRIFKHYLELSLNSNYKIPEPYAYIEGFSTEFDLLIVSKEAKTTEQYNNAYDPKDVKFGIEIKAHGVFGGRKELKKAIQRIKSNFEEVKNSFPHINFLYFTFEEVMTPKRKTSINYLTETINHLNPYEVFCLRDSRDPDIIREGEWSKLVDCVKNTLEK